MVYTVTFNPSLDYIVDVPGFELGRTNRTESELMLPGGKGLNVSTVLNNLGVRSKAIYFSAGFVGEEITRRIHEIGIESDEIRISEGCSRINLKLRTIEGTEINGAGPKISNMDIRELYDHLDKLKAGDILVLAGSIPSTMPETIYSDIMGYLEGRDIRFVVDATKDLLLNALKFKPFLIKPNDDELREIFGESDDQDESGLEFKTRKSVIPYAEKLRELGAENVIVSMGGEGAVFAASDGKVYELPAPEGELVNAVGAGDSMVAGFLAGYLEKKDLVYAFKLAVSAGSASAFSDNMATREEVERVFDSIFSQL